MGKKEISNEEFNKALSDSNNTRIMKSVSMKFQNSLDEATLENCQLHGLWRSLQYHNPEKGQKFTTFLYRATLWECYREYSRLKKFRRGNISIHETNLDVAYSIPQDIIDLLECIELLPDKDRKILRQYWFEGRTMQEIGDINGYSKEAARQKINKAEAALKEVYIV